MSKSKKPKPATVAFTAKQAGETQAQFPFGEENSRWAWVESSVWTDRMLTALENGVKGGTWFSLIDKVYSHANLESAAMEAAGNGGAAGVDRVTIEMFMDRQPANLERLSEALQTGTYEPQAVLRTWIPQPGTREQRPLGIPTVSDRVVQNALRHVLEPIFERDFAEHSYGVRPGRSCLDALARVEALLQAGYTHVVDADLKGYFDTIDHDLLMERIEEKVSDGRVLSLLRQMLQQGIFEDGQTWTPETGSPQGSVLSPLLSNIHLDPLDHLLAAHGLAMVRYADDFVVLCRSRSEAEAALELIRPWVEQAGLTLHPTKTQIVDAASEGFCQSIRSAVNYQPESRMRANRTYGSEGGAAEPNRPSLPLSWPRLSETGFASRRDAATWVRLSAKRGEALPLFGIRPASGATSCRRSCVVLVWDCGWPPAPSARS